MVSVLSSVLNVVRGFRLRTFLRSSTIGPLLLMASSMFAVPVATASYFADTAPTSIDERMLGCFSNNDCAEQSRRLIPIFAKHRGMSIEEVAEALHSCLTPDRNMAFCVQYEAFALQDEFESTLASVPSHLAKSIEIAKLRKYYNGIDRRCQTQIAEQYPDKPGGLFLQEVLSSCKATATVAAVVAARKLVNRVQARGKAHVPGQRGTSP